MSVVKEALNFCRCAFLIWMDPKACKTDHTFHSNFYPVKKEDCYGKMGKLLFSFYTSVSKLRVFFLLALIRISSRDLS